MGVQSNEGIGDKEASLHTTSIFVDRSSLLCGSGSSIDVGSYSCNGARFLVLLVPYQQTGPIRLYRHRLERGCVPSTRKARSPSVGRTIGWNISMEQKRKWTKASWSKVETEMASDSICAAWCAFGCCECMGCWMVSLFYGSPKNCEWRKSFRSMFRSCQLKAAMDLQSHVSSHYDYLTQIGRAS